VTPMAEPVGEIVTAAGEPVAELATEAVELLAIDVQIDLLESAYLPVADLLA
jgi:hypothetical protein